MEYILSLISGGIGGAIVIWLMKNWFAERIKQSIKAEYDEILERLKTSLAFREKALDILIHAREELPGTIDLSTVKEALQANNPTQYNVERKDEYTANCESYKKIRYLFNESVQ